MSDSVTQWLKQLSEGDRAAVQRLWERYFQNLVQLARRQLEGVPAYRADPEDLALSAFKSFCLAAEQQRFPRLEDRDDLWQILVMLTQRKAANLREYHRTARRDHRREALQADLAPDDAPDRIEFFQRIEGREPDPAFAAEVAEECRHLLQQLPDERLRRIALLKLESYTNQEIAGVLNCAPTTVERKLARIRRHWEEHVASREMSFGARKS
jgi:DNA-directed RNA polymerase specialized sigma24 family protein